MISCLGQYVKAVQVAPTYQEAAYEIGRVCMTQGDHEGARVITGKLDPYLRDLLLKEMEIVDWIEKDGTISPNPLVLKMDDETRPTIQYKEKADYTSMARDHNIRGIVILSMFFGANKKIGGVRIVQDYLMG
jgi:hypothetical protein